MTEPLIPCAVYIEDIPATPIGPIWLAVTDRSLAAVEFADSRNDFLQALARRGFFPFLEDPSRTCDATQQIQEFLQGERTSFEIPIDWSAMGEFQRRVLQRTWEIPFGQTITYGELARQIGKPGAARAVGRAQATNPMPLVIPCHRVVGSDGKLHGYGGRGGITTKAWLLELEQARQGMPGQSRAQA